jgi:hypothetical protein
MHVDVRSFRYWCGVYLCNHVWVFYVYTIPIFELNFFLHLVRPMVLLPSCLGHSFFSSGGSSFPLSLRFCLAGRQQCLVITNSNICTGYSRGRVNSSESLYSAEFCPHLRPYFLSYYPCTESDTPQLSRAPMPAPCSRTRCGLRVSLPYQSLPSTLYYSCSMWWYFCITRTQRLRAIFLGKVQGVVSVVRVVAVKIPVPVSQHNGC